MKGKLLDKLKGSKLKTFVGGLKKSTPELLIAAGIVAMGAAVVLAIKNAPKAEEEVKKKKAMYKEKGEEMPKTDEVLTHVKHQAGTIILFTTGAAAVVGANAIQHKRNIALALALEAAEASAGDLEGKFKRLLGKEQVEKAKEENEKQKKERPYVMASDSDVVRIKDTFTGISFWSTVQEVEQAVKDVNYRLAQGDSVSVRTFYDTMNVIEGMVPSHSLLGWCANDKYGGFMLDLEWGTDIDNGRPVMTFEYSTEPSTDFMDV